AHERAVAGTDRTADVGVERHGHAQVPADVEEELVAAVTYEARAHRTVVVERAELARAEERLLRVVGDRTVLEVDRRVADVRAALLVAAREQKPQVPV